MNALQAEEPPVEVKDPVVVPQPLHDVEPFLRVGVAARMVGRQVEPEGGIFRRVPSGDDVQPCAAVADTVERRDLLGDDDGVVRSDVDGGDYRDGPGRGQKAGRPDGGFQNVALEVDDAAAIADPPRDRQEEVETRVVAHSGETQIVVPRRVPSLRDSCDGHAVRAIGREDAELEAVLLPHWVADCHRHVHSRETREPT